MKRIMVVFALALLTSCGDSGKKEAEEVNLEEKAQQIHDKVLTVDTHCDINVANFTDSINYTQRLETQVNLPKMEEGGLDVVWFIVYTGQDTLTDEGYAKARENAMEKFDAIHRLCEEYAPDRIGLATTSDEARKLDAAGKKVAMIGVENAYPLGESIEQIQEYYDKGARYISLAHNGHSQFADSNTGEEDGQWLHNGLSDLGKEAVAEMNRLGIMIDVSHPSKESMKQMLELSKAPIIASHSSARALCDHSRNLDDEQLGWMKENGGVVQAVGLGAYLNKEKSEARSEYLSSISKSVADSLGITWYDRSQLGDLAPEQRTEFFKHYRAVRKVADSIANTREDAPEEVDVKDLVDHIDYMVEKMGIDYVGISSDFDGGGGIKGWEDASETFNVTKELVERGYNEEEIAKLWGGNLLRVLDEVQAVAKSIKDDDGV